MHAFGRDIGHRLQEHRHGKRLEGAIKPVKLLNNLKMGVLQPKLNVYDYSLARSLMLKRKPDYDHYPCIFVGWDNTPRRGKNAIIITNAKSELFESGLSDFIEASLDKPYDDRLIFINAWNEWAEGNHLEPDMKNGNTHLEAVRLINTYNGSTQ